MRKIAIFALALFMLVSWACPVYAGVPSLPHTFYGKVTINGSVAPDGTKISAKVSQGDIVKTQNPVTTVEGSYGVKSMPLLVQGDIQSGATISFYVDGVEAKGQTATYEVGGGPTERPLSVTISVSGGGNGGGTEQPPVKTNIFGTKKNINISKTGVVQETIKATSEDGKLTVTIPKGTKALDEKGKPLEKLESAVDESPPDPPEEANVIGLAYDFGPEGATFDPPMSLTFRFDLEELPEGVDPADLVLAFYDEETGKWVELECEVDTDAKTVTAKVSHFTTFALIAPTPKPEPPAPPPPPVKAPEPPKPPPVEKPEAPAPSPPAPEKAPEKAPLPPLPGAAPEGPPVPPAAPSFPWEYVALGAATVLVIAVVVWVFTRRRSY